MTKKREENQVEDLETKYILTKIKNFMISLTVDEFS